MRHVCAYLGYLQQYNAVFNGLYHTLEKHTKTTGILKGAASQRSRNKTFALFLLTQVVSFKFSIFCQKQKKRKITEQFQQYSVTN